MKNGIEERVRLHCSTLPTNYFHRCQDPWLIGCGRKPRGSSPLSILTLRSWQLFGTQWSHPGSFMSSHPPKVSFSKFHVSISLTHSIWILTPASKPYQEKFLLVLMLLSKNNLHNISYPSPQSPKEGDTELSLNTDLTSTDLKALRGNRPDSD